jgi:lipopolysaccharide transport system ATP-binding protein
MSNIAFEMDHVSKKFKKGEIHDSLRDLIPAMFSSLFRGRKTNPLGENEFWALDDVSFCVKRGEALGIIGRNGAGKSTMLKLLCGIMKPTSGNIKVNGTLSALIEVGAGFHADLTGRENIFLNGTILGMKKEQIKKKFDEIVDFSGLEDFLDTPVKRYSSGMYARLGFSVAAHVDPEILVVDEVLSVGDYSFQNKCLEKMQSILKSDTTVIFVSHNMKAVSDLCPQCILLERGKIVKNGPVDEVIDLYLNPKQETSEANELKEAYISNVRISKGGVESALFETGDNARFEIEVKGKKSCNKLSVTIYIENDKKIGVFDTSTQRLNDSVFSLEPDETKKIVFDLNLHLVPGTYRIIVFIYRYDIKKMYDVREPAATIQVRSDKDVRGIANLYPNAFIE